MREAIWGKPAPGLSVCKTSPGGGRSYLLPAQPTPEQLQQVLAGDAGIHPGLEVLEGATDHWLHVLHRVKEGRDVFFIANQNHRASRALSVSASPPRACPSAGMPCATRSPPCRSRETGRQVELSLTMEPNESVLLVFQPNQRALPLRLEPASMAALKTIAVLRDPAPAQPEAPTLPRQRAGAGARGLLLDLVP